jgi:hypothetical protein
VLERAGESIEGFHALFVMNHEDGGLTARVARGRMNPPACASALGFFRLGSAGWLLHLTWAATLNFAAGYPLTL